MGFRPETSLLSFVPQAPRAHSPSLATDQRSMLLCLRVQTKEMLHLTSFESAHCQGPWQECSHLHTRESVCRVSSAMRHWAGSQHYPLRKSSPRNDGGGANPGRGMWGRRARTVSGEHSGQTRDRRSNAALNNPNTETLQGHFCRPKSGPFFFFLHRVDLDVNCEQLML